MRLCCLHDGFNGTVGGTVGLSLSQVFLKSVSEDGRPTIGLEATEGFLGLQQAETDDGEDPVQPLQDAARDARSFVLQTPGQVAQQPGVFAPSTMNSRGSVGSTPLLRERTTSRAIAVVAPLELEIQLGGPVPGLGPLVMGL